MHTLDENYNYLLITGDKAIIVTKYSSQSKLTAPKESAATEKELCMHPMNYAITALITRIYKYPLNIYIMVGGGS